MKKFLVSTAALGAMLASATTATAGDVSISASADYVSEYVFRGVSLANTAVQPAIEASYGGFTAGIWASVALGESSILAGDEIDLYGSYGWNVTEKLSASVGATLFHFPQSGGLFNFDSEELGSTFEAYAGVAYDTVLAPSFNLYYDFTLDAFTLEGSVSHSFPVAEKTSFDLGLTGGHVTVNNSGNYEWATGSAALSYALTDATSFYVGANFSVNSEDLLDYITIGDIEDALEDIGENLGDATFDDLGNLTLQSDDTQFWGGVGFSTNF